MYRISRHNLLNEREQSPVEEEKEYQQCLARRDSP